MQNLRTLLAKIVRRQRIRNLQRANTVGISAKLFKPDYYLRNAQATLAVRLMAAR
ncbi:hypothetical protein HBN54_003082 [Hymenobacter sp. 1B]|uniref:Uncharacterized protein n=1 Tax=Hymenobacter artigasi TaxID=2719616 RepID=A0ABX1HJP3_9BACT|nr:hypothetical protein [Hymenobacter artigasi]